MERLGDPYYLQPGSTGSAESLGPPLRVSAKQEAKAVGNPSPESRFGGTIETIQGQNERTEDVPVEILRRDWWQPEGSAVPGLGQAAWARENQLKLRMCRSVPRGTPKNLGYRAASMFHVEHDSLNDTLT